MFEVCYFDMIKSLIKMYKIFIFKKILYKRYYKKFFYSFLLKIWLHFNLFTVFKNKELSMIYYIKMTFKDKFYFFINFFNHFIKYYIYVYIKRELKRYKWDIFHIHKNYCKFFMDKKKKKYIYSFFLFKKEKKLFNFFFNFFF